MTWFWLTRNRHRLCPFSWFSWNLLGFIRPLKPWSANSLWSMYVISLLKGIDQVIQEYKTMDHCEGHHQLENGAPQWCYREQCVPPKLTKGQEENFSGRLPTDLQQHLRSCGNMWQVLVTSCKWQQSLICLNDGAGWLDRIPSLQKKNRIQENRIKQVKLVYWAKTKHTQTAAYPSMVKHGGCSMML